MGSSSDAEGLEVEDEGFEESLPFDGAEVPLVEPELVEVDGVGDAEGEDSVAEGGDEVVDGADPVEFGGAGGGLLAVVEVEPPDDFESSLSAAPSLRRWSTGRPLLLSSSSMTGGA